MKNHNNEMNKYIIIACIIITLSILATVVSSKIKKLKIKNNNTDIVPIEYSTIKAKKSINTITVLGKFKPTKYADIKPPYHGYIKKITAPDMDNNYIQKDDLLFQISSSEIESDYDKAKSLYEYAQYNYNVLLASKKTGQEMKKAKTEMNTALSDLEKIEKRMNITAPFSGRLGVINIVKGQFVDERSVLAKLTNSENGCIYFYLHKENITNIAIQDVVSVYDDLNKEHHAKIIEIDNITENNNILVKAKFINECYDFYLDEILKTEITLSIKENALFVKNSTIRYSNGKSYIYTIMSASMLNEDIRKKFPNIDFIAIKVQVEIKNEKASHDNYDVEIFSEELEKIVENDPNVKIVSRGSVYHGCPVSVYESSDNNDNTKDNDNEK